MVVGLVVTAAVSLLHRGDIFTAAAPAGANRSHDAETAAARLRAAHIVYEKYSARFFCQITKRISVHTKVRRLQSRHDVHSAIMSELPMRCEESARES